MTSLWGPDPLLDKASFRFVQDGNSVGTTEETEELEVQLVTQMPGEQPFLVIRTSTGWSLDDVEELTKLLRACLAAGAVKVTS